MSKLSIINVNKLTVINIISINKYASDLLYKLTDYSLFSKLALNRYVPTNISGNNIIYKMYKFYNNLGFSMISSTYSLHGCTLYNYIHDSSNINNYTDIRLKTGGTLRDKDYCLIVILTNT